MFGLDCNHFHPCFTLAQAGHAGGRRRRKGMNGERKGKRRRNDGKEKEEKEEIGHRKRNTGKEDIVMEREGKE